MSLIGTIFSSKIAAQSLRVALFPNSRSFSTTFATESKEAKWSPGTMRPGVIAVKQGMTALWDDITGERIPVTVLLLDDVQVIESNTFPGKGDEPARHSIVVGASKKKVHRTSSALMGQFNKAGVEPKVRLAEFKVTENALVPPGTTISACHFVPGQYVDVQATSIGKGFQGVMKRHGFKGLPATHGHSLSHRSAGSTGQHQDPGRVWPGRKMAGHMGNTNVTTQNLLVQRIDNELNVVYVKGCVPGPPGGFVKVTDAIKKVKWVIQKRVDKGLIVGQEGEEVVPGVTGFPMPGTPKLAATLPREIVAPPKSQ